MTAICTVSLRIHCEFVSGILKFMSFQDIKDLTMDGRCLYKYIITVLFNKFGKMLSPLALFKKVIRINVHQKECLGGLIWSWGRIFMTGIEAFWLNGKAGSLLSNTILVFIINLVFSGIYWHFIAPEPLCPFFKF